MTKKKFLSPQDIDAAIAEVAQLAAEAQIPNHLPTTSFTTQSVNTAVSRMFTLSENNKCMNRISMDGSILEGDLPRPQLLCVGAWVYMHQNELLDAWERASRHLKPRKIAPL